MYKKIGNLILNKRKLVLFAMFLMFVGKFTLLLCACVFDVVLQELVFYVLRFSCVETVCRGCAVVLMLVFVFFVLCFVLSSCFVEFC